LNAAHHLPPFVCALVPAGDTIHVEPIGDLDLYSVPALDRYLREAHASGAACVVLDLRGLSFLDSTGIQLIVRWHHHAEATGVGFEVVQGNATVSRVLELCGMDGVLRFRDAVRRDEDAGSDPV
jgi:anti-anti-sigma factor